MRVMPWGQGDQCLAGTLCGGEGSRPHRKVVVLGPAQRQDRVSLGFDASRYRPKAYKRGEPLAKPIELEPVKRKKAEPRAQLARTSAKGAAKKAKQFGEQAERCRNSPCCCCGRVGEDVVAHHWPTRAAGGLDADTCALCAACHDVFHVQCGSPEAFLELMGCDVLAEIEKMRKGARRPYVRDCGPCIPRLIEDRRKLSYRHECVKCARPMDDPADLDGVAP